MSNYQAQFDKAHSVSEITEANGFVILVEDLEDEIARVEENIRDVDQKLQESIASGDKIDPEHYTQKMIGLNAQLVGLRFISNQVEYYERRKSEAIKHLQ